jgi:hypothetical protein
MALKGRAFLAIFRDGPLPREVRAINLPPNAFPRSGLALPLERSATSPALSSSTPPEIAIESDGGDVRS